MYELQPEQLHIKDTNYHFVYFVPCLWICCGYLRYFSYKPLFLENVGIFIINIQYIIHIKGNFLFKFYYRLQIIWVYRLSSLCILVTNYLHNIRKNKKCRANIDFIRNRLGIDFLKRKSMIRLLKICTFSILLIIKIFFN